MKDRAKLSQNRQNDGTGAVLFLTLRRTLIYHPNKQKISKSSNMIYSNLACGKCKIGGVDDKGEHYGLGQIQKKLYDDDKDEHGLRQIQKKLYDDKDEHGLRQIQKKLYDDKDEHGLGQIQKKLYDKDEHDLRQIQKKLYMTKMNMALAHAI
jgi:hypothetical protein